MQEKRHQSNTDWPRYSVTRPVPERRADERGETELKRTRDERGEKDSRSNGTSLLLGLVTNRNSTVILGLLSSEVSGNEKDRDSFVATNRTRRTTNLRKSHERKVPADDGRETRKSSNLGQNPDLDLNGTRGAESARRKSLEKRKGGKVFVWPSRP